MPEQLLHHHHHAASGSSGSSIRRSTPSATAKRRASSSSLRTRAAASPRSSSSLNGNHAISSASSSQSPLRPQPPRSILVPQQEHQQHDDLSSTAVHCQQILASLLRFLPKAASQVSNNIDPAAILKVLSKKNIHPSALGQFKDRETWREENPHVLHDAINNDGELSSNQLRRTESCPSPRERYHDDTSTLQHAAACPAVVVEPSPVASTSRHLLTPSPTSLSGSSSSVASESLHLLRTTQSPTSRSQLRRQPSDASISASTTLTTASSACTCSSSRSRASTSSSIRFIEPPNKSELRKLRNGRTPEFSFAMGIRGRANLLKGKMREGDDSDDDLLDTEEQTSDREHGDDEVELEVNDGMDSDVEDLFVTKKKDEVTMRFGKDGQVLEKRPLGVTLEEFDLIPQKPRKKLAAQQQQPLTHEAISEHDSASNTPHASPHHPHKHLHFEPIDASKILSPTSLLDAAKVDAPFIRGRSHKIADRSSAFASTQVSIPTSPESPTTASAAPAGSNLESRSSSSSGSNTNAVQSPGSVSGDEMTPMPTPRSHSPVFALRHGFTSLSGSKGRSVLTERRQPDEPTSEKEMLVLTAKSDCDHVAAEDDEAEDDDDQGLAFSSSSPSASSPELRSEPGEDDIEDIHGARFQLDFIPPGPTSYNEVGSDYEDHPDFEDLFGDQDDTTLAGVQRVITSPIKSFWARPYFASATVKTLPSTKQNLASPNASPQRGKNSPRHVSPSQQQSQSQQSSQQSSQRKRVSSH